MNSFIDKFLNSITMYRLVLYYLIGLVIAALFFGFLGVLPYKPLDIIFSILLIIIVSLISNSIFAKTFEAIPNVESVYITALILVLIVTPARTTADFWFLFWAGILATASKYILALNKKHFFNPAAVAVVITALIISKNASWWIGTSAMFPFVLVGGYLVVRKIKRFDMVYYFCFFAIVTILISTILHGGDVISSFTRILLYSPLFFLAFVMLTEPLTTPPGKKMQIFYGVIVGLLFAPQTHLGSLYFTPELALVAGNIFSYAVSPKKKVLLKLKAKTLIADNTYDFVFQSDQRMSFTPGQYLEWTLPGDKNDNRGNRRYFTIASSPTEADIRMGVKFYEESSTFKRALLSMKPGDKIMAGQLSGDFTLPNNNRQKLVFIAGGIGITPFRSMIQSLLDRRERRDIILFYSNKNVREIAYAEVFNLAETKIGLKPIYTLTDTYPAGWQGKLGYINKQMITETVPDYQERLFYISGPRSIVVALKQTLIEMGISKEMIRTDYFPGFA